jgi:hypothetical protein
MPSVSLINWQATRSQSLDELENAHRSVGGSRRGRRFATQQINQAYAVLLSSQFQGFCRDLHTEAVTYLSGNIKPTYFTAILKAEFFLHRQLDNKNPTPSTIGADFNRLGLNFWDEVIKRSHLNSNRRDDLDALNRWRNAIAHQDFDPTMLGGGTVLHLSLVKYWRKACNRLASDFDNVLRYYLFSLTGTNPW